MIHRSILLVFLVIFLGSDVLGQDKLMRWQAGVAKIDITPSEPLRLSGYAARKDISVGISDPLHARALVLRHNNDDPLVIVSIDAIGITGDMTNRIAKAVQEGWEISRSRMVLAATHSHSAPHLDGYAPNIFHAPLTEEEQSATKRYSQAFEKAIIDSIAKAMSNMQDVRIRFGSGNATVAANRRVLEKGIWKGFGQQADGIVDHRIGVLAIEDLNGKLKSVVYNYACHATTIPPASARYLPRRSC